MLVAPHLALYDINIVICNLTLNVLLQAMMATIMIGVGDIGELIEAFSAAAFVFYMLVFIAVLIMRVTHRDKPRLFKVTLDGV